MGAKALADPVTHQELQQELDALRRAIRLLVNGHVQSRETINEITILTLGPNNRTGVKWPASK